MKAAMTAMERPLKNICRVKFGLKVLLHVKYLKFCNPDLKRVCGRKKAEDLRRWKKLTGLEFPFLMFKAV